MPGGRDLQAYVLIQTDLGRVGDILDLVAKLPGVVRADAVTGPYDIVALIDLESIEEIGREVVEGVQVIEGITRTLTCAIGQTK